MFYYYYYYTTYYYKILLQLYIRNMVIYNYEKKEIQPSGSGSIIKPQ